MSLPALRFDAVVKEFSLGEARVRALDGLTLELAAGTFTAIVGRSGSGKSTLLNLAAGLDRPTSGEVFLAGQPLSRLGDDEITRLRRERVGVVYQFFHLLPTLEVRENVALPLLLEGVPESQALARAGALLAEVGLEPRARARPHTLSGGELQRAAVARALVHEPALVLADEPTGNLATRSAAQVVALLASLVRRHRATLVLVTHSAEASAEADRVITLSDGRVVHDAAVTRNG
ncbi:MAG TPA: ABC transporter ATP-binding protein [Planctomycetota bacterium]|nr:ABC transporter ATP-binding protein [Planctomycetota bacterium]